MAPTVGEFVAAATRAKGCSRAEGVTGMKVTIIGTGNMGRSIGLRALAGGHEVSYIGTHLSKAQELADEMIGEGGVWASEGVDGDIVVLAVPHSEAPHVVREYSEQLGGRIVIDPTNPVDFSLVEPLDGAWIAPFPSGGQLIAAETPNDAAFVKAFNTNFAKVRCSRDRWGVSRLTYSSPAMTKRRRRRWPSWCQAAVCARSMRGTCDARESWRRPLCCTWRFRAPGRPVSSQRSRSYPDREARHGVAGGRVERALLLLLYHAEPGPAQAASVRSPTRPTATGPAG